MNSNEFLKRIDELIREYSQKNMEKFLVREEYIDHGLHMKRNPEYLFEIIQFSEDQAQKDGLEESLEIVRVGMNAKFFTKLTDRDRGKMLVQMNGDGIAQRLLHIQTTIRSGFVQPPGPLFHDKEHSKLKIRGVKLRVP